MIACCYDLSLQCDSPDHEDHIPRRAQFTDEFGSKCRAAAYHFGGERERRNRLAWREAEDALVSALQAWRAAPAEGSAP